MRFPLRPRSHPTLARLSSFLDGEAGAESAALAAHVAACPRCAERLAGWRRARAALRGLPRPLPPPELHLRLRLGLTARGGGAVAWLAALRLRRVLAPVCALLFVAGIVVTYLENEARARASTTARESLERLLAADRFESILDGPPPAPDRRVGEIWVEPGLGLAPGGPGEADAPLRRLAAGSSEARSLLAAHGDARRAFELPGVQVVRLRAASGAVEIERPRRRW